MRLVVTIILCLAICFTFFWSFINFDKIAARQETLTAELKQITETEKEISEKIEKLEKQINTIKSSIKIIKKDYTDLNTKFNSLSEEVETHNAEIEDKNHYWGNVINTNDAYIYTVQAGDTVAKISNAFGVPIDLIINRNNIIDVYKLEIGTVLTLPKD